jgi:hypothetical protein
MPWQCVKHKTILSGNKADGALTCPKCGDATFVNWTASADEVEGILVKTAANFEVYVETHQGKHTVPN